jgi:hypothetical protein
MGGIIMFTRKTLNHLRWLCRAVIAGSGLFSIWANILHVVNPTIPAIIFAAAPPIVVLLGWEMVSRIPIREDAAWYVKFARPVITGSLAFGGAWLSYWHQKDAIFRYNAGDLQNAMILPLLIDGLMIIASVSVYELNQRIRAMDAKQAAFDELTKAQQAKVDAAAQPQEKPLTGKQKIALAMTTLPPWATVKEIAAEAQVKENYAATVVSELRKAQRTNGNGAQVGAIA